MASSGKPTVVDIVRELEYMTHVPDRNEIEYRIRDLLSRIYRYNGIEAEQT